MSEARAARVGDGVLDPAGANEGEQPTTRAPIDGADPASEPGKRERADGGHGAQPGPDRKPSPPTEEQHSDIASGDPQLIPDAQAGQPDLHSEEAVESSRSEDSRADSLLELAQRTQADFENYRKRMARELEGAQARGVSRLAGELVPALDNLERAIAAASEAADADEQLIEGLRLVQRELLAALARAGVERYGEAGVGFDPSLHEAVAHQPIDGAEAGAVVEVYQAGYRLGTAVIRPARVLVAA